MSIQKTAARPFGVKDQIGYVCGDMAGSFVNLYVDAYFLTFCTYVLGINAGWMATLFLAARLWDAVNDPIIGSFPDRWRLGKGPDKFKPWIRLFMVPLALSGVLCFWQVPLRGVALHAYVAFAYVLYGMCYTGTSMPFGAMANVVSVDPVERSKLSRARSIGGSLVGIGAVSFVPVICFDAESNIIPGRFTLLAVIFGACCLIGYTILNACTPERYPEPARGQKFRYGRVLKAALRNRPLIGVMVATVGSMLSITGGGQLSSYIFKEYFHNTGAMTLTALSTVPVMIILFPLAPKLVARFGKRRVIVVTTAFGLVLNLSRVIVPISNVYVYVVHYMISSVSQGIFTMLIWALVSDCLDYSEWKEGVRSDGSMYSLYTFSRKIGSTLASTGAASALSAIGYVSGIGAVQSAGTVRGIYYLVCLVPVASCVLELIGVGLIFNLDLETTGRMYRELADKRKAGAPAAKGR